MNHSFCQPPRSIYLKKLSRTQKTNTVFLFLKMDCVLIILGFMVLCFTVQVQGSCGRRVFTRRQPRIMGSQSALKGEIPWIGSLKHEGKHICGVTLYNKRFLIGAAHCFEMYGDTEKLTVALGQNNISKKEDSVTLFAKVENIIIHPNYSQSMRGMINDIALLKLSEDVKFNAFIQPACLPDEDLSEGTVATVAGWGLSGVNFKEPQILQKVNLNVYSNANCASILIESQVWREANIPESQVCAGWAEGGRYIQPGDSGGGLYFESGGKWTVAGITSHNIRHSVMEGDLPGVFTRVNTYTKWIREVTTNSE